MTAPFRPNLFFLLLFFLAPAMFLGLCPMPWQWSGDSRPKADAWRGLLQALIFNGICIAVLGALLRLWGPPSPTIPPPRQALIAVLGLGIFLWVVAIGFGWVWSEKESTEAQERTMAGLVRELESLRAQDRAREEEREGLIRKLQGALQDVRTLTGLIPICASCKKVRDDDGYWQQVESYIQAHSRATFTHGFCPECAAHFRGEMKATVGGSRE